MPEPRVKGDLRSERLQSRVFPLRNTNLLRLPRVTLSTQQVRSTPLPDGYNFIKTDESYEAELSNLLEVLPQDDGEKYDVAHRNALLRIHDLDAFDIAVCSEEGNLVGFGAILFNGDSGHLCDFVVDERHRGQGIGRAIISRRLKIAERAGVLSLSAHLEPNNTLRPYYVEHGFRSLPDGRLNRGPNTVEFPGLSH